MQNSKTIDKRACKSEHFSQDLTKTNEPKCKSQLICESTTLIKNGKSTVFNVFPDARVGFSELRLPLMPLEADEDCETTTSVKNHGQKICFIDLKESLRIPHEQTQTDSSYTSYEDC